MTGGRGAVAFHRRSGHRDPVAIGIGIIGYGYRGPNLLRNKDTVVLLGNRADYTLVSNSADLTTLVLARGDDTKRIHDAEVPRFADRTVSVRSLVASPR
jgi:hypothetical protein